MNASIRSFFGVPQAGSVSNVNAIHASPKFIGFDRTQRILILLGAFFTPNKVRYNRSQAT
jgi:hypothetical protein